MKLLDSVLHSLDLADTRLISLVESLDEEQLRVPYEPGINPPVWEVGHTAFFYEYFLLRRLRGVAPIMPGYDAVWDSFEIPHRERWEAGVVPDKATTLAYYRRVLDETREFLVADGGDSDEALYLGQYVVAHQCMHLESLIWCRQTLGYPAPPWSEPLEGSGRKSLPSSDAHFPGGPVRIGVPHPEPGETSVDFSFDNEQPAFEKELAPFAISRTLVTQGQFLDFVEDGGYTRTELWSTGGTYWRRKFPRTHPAYWEKRDGLWTVRRFDQIAALDPAAPVLHVSYWEAEAFCRWAGRRLPGEMEWEAAARGRERRKFPWGETMPSDPASLAALADLDARHLGTAPVDAYAAGATPEGCHPEGCLQLIGTCWEWTSDQYLPYDGFRVDMYAYMSTLQFGTHKTTRGGSFASSASLVRSTYRQAYHPDRSDVFTGFRTCAIP